MSEITELTGEETGRWLVHTKYSRLLFDFDARTAERFPGPGASVLPVTGPQFLSGIRSCRVGARCEYDFLLRGGDLDPWPYLGTVVVRIESVPVGGMDTLFDPVQK